MLNIKKFLLGLGLTPKPTSQIDSKGELEVIDSTGKLQYHNGADVSPVVTESHSATLSNKTIDADSNIITNIDNNEIKANAGIDATKIADGSVSNTEFQYLDGVTSSIQTQLNTNSSDISSHTSASSNVHGIGASSSVVGTQTSQTLTNKTIDADSNIITNIDNADIKSGAAIDRDKLASGTANRVVINNGSGVMVDASAITANRAVISDANGIPTHSAVTNTELARLSGVTADIQPQLTSSANHIAASTDVHQIGHDSAVVGTQTAQTLTNKTLTSAILTSTPRLSGYISEESQDNTQSGSSVTLTGTTKPIVRLTNASLTSVTGISALSASGHGGVVTLVNTTANEITILNDVGTAADRILTGVDDDIDLAPNAALFLKYDTVSSRWRVIGGTGAGNTIIKAVAGENLTAKDVVYLSVGAADGGRTAGQAYGVDASNSNRRRVVGFVKETVTAGNTAKIVTSGIIKGFTGLTVGEYVYANPTTPGSFSQTAPSDSSYVDRWVITVGIAISATQVLINPDLASSSYFNSNVIRTFTIANNISTPTDVTGIVFDQTVTKSFLIDYRIQRSTSTTSAAQAGRIRGVYNTVTATWLLSDDYSGENAGVEFTITTLGQLQYTSSNLSGTGYTGTLEYRTVVSEGLHILGVMTTDGDIIMRSAGVPTRLPIGANNSLLKVTSGLPTWTDNLTATASTLFFRNNTAGGTSAIEVGTGGTGNRNSLIDLTGDDTYTDYGLRIIRNNGGPNANSDITHRGTGQLLINAQDAGSLSLATNNVGRLNIAANGAINLATAATSSTKFTAQGNQNTVVGTATGGLGAIEVLGAGGETAAYMTFHRPGAYAVYFGLDTDNFLRVGGWSMGANSQRVFHGDAPGSAPVYACRAWVNFNGTIATPSTIRASGNVSTITRTATGDYTVHFLTNMPDTEYSTFVGTNSIGAGNANMAGEHSATVGGAATSRLVGSIRIFVGTSGGVQNYSNVNVAVFR